MRKEVRSYFDPKTGFSYNVNIRTGIVCRKDGEYPDKATETRIFNAIRSRLRSEAKRNATDSLMRDLGMVKVRGAVTGSTYWE